MPAGVDEATWKRAKKQAAKQGRGDNYAYIQSIYQKMKKALPTPPPALPTPPPMTAKSKEKADDEDEGEAKPMSMPGIPADAVRKSIVAGARRMFGRPLRKSLTKAESGRLLTRDDLRKAYYGGDGNIERWSSQFYGTPLYVEALRHLKACHENEKRYRQVAKKHKDWDELREMGRTAREAEEEKYRKLCKPIDAERKQLMVQREELEQKLLDHKIAQAEAMAKMTKSEQPADKDDGEGKEDGDHEHHRDRALAHLQAAQAHATAAHSAKKVEEVKEHSNVVGQAEQASQAAMALGDKPKGTGRGKGRGRDKEVKEVKKSQGPELVRFKSQIVDMNAEDEVLAYLENGGLIDQSCLPGGQHEARQRLAAMRGGRLAKATIYAGERNTQGSREGDGREQYMRERELREMMHFDPDGTDGNGGLPGWWGDHAHRVQVPAFVKSIRPPAPRVVVKPDTAHQRALDSDPYNRKGFAIDMAANGQGREVRRDGR